MQEYNIDYHRIATAIEYIRENFKAQPDLEEVARKVHLSPFHFQRLFTDWAGVSPKKFLQYISLEHAKKLLKTAPLTAVDTALETGLSGTGRLHDLFVKIEGMTPAEYKRGGEELTIQYSFGYSPFGPLLVAATTKGICQLTFADDAEQALTRLKADFPAAYFVHRADPMQEKALQIFSKDWSDLKEIKLHLKGTAFQLKVWQSLLNIPLGGLTTYGQIAHQIEQPNASRAVGTAIGSNPVAFLIPCHRVIQASGEIGGYMWGPTRKSAIIGWEAARTESL